MSVHQVHDRVFDVPCLITCANEATPAAGMLREATGRLVDLLHPALPRVIATFCGSPLAIGPGATPAPVTGFATEWVDGALLDATRPLPLAERCALVAGLLQVVRYLHARGVLHLDLSPSVVRVRAGRVRLTRFGGFSEPSQDAVAWLAPEVRGGAASGPASDLFSVGALAWDLLAGAPRAPGASLPAPPARPRLGEVAPDLAPDLCALVDALLAPDPAGRPATAEAALRAWTTAGLPTPRESLGAPPFAGRNAELEALCDALDGEYARPITVVGPPGIGKRRLVRQALARSAAAGVPILDLSCAPRPVQALYHLLVGPDAPPADPGDTVDACATRLAALGSASGILHLGHREDHPADVAEALDRMAPLLADAGFKVVSTARVANGDARPLALNPIGPAFVSQLCTFYAIADPPASRSRVGPAAPGAAVRQLHLASPLTRPLTPAQSAARSRLAALPQPIPPEVLGHLPPDLVEALPALRAADAVSIDPQGHVDVDPEAAGPIDETLAAALRRAAADPGTDPLWAALATVRLGDPDLPTERFASACAVADGRDEALVELTGSLARARRDAAWRYVRLQLDHGRAAHAVAAGTLHPPETEVERALWARALREAGHLARAVEEVPAPTSDPERAERARALLALDRRSDAAAVLAGTGSCDHPEVLAARAAWMEASAAAGEAIGDVLPLLRAVETLDRPAASLLAAAGRVGLLGGASTRGLVLLERAARVADATGQPLDAAEHRATLGEALAAQGVERAARQSLLEALLSARANEVGPLLRRLYAALADLELRAGRLAASRRWIDDLAAITPAADPVASARRALLDARQQLAEGRPAAALALLPRHPPRGLAALAAVVHATAALALDRVDDAARALEQAPPPPDVGLRRRMATLWGRVRLAQARAALGEARRLAPAQPLSLDRREVGEILLYQAGESLDPGGIAARRADLTAAAQWLDARDAERALAIRDRLHTSAGASIDDVALLVASIRDPARFARSLAEIVSTNLDVPRVLVLRWAPGTRAGARDLTGHEAGRLGAAIQERLREPGDLWLVADGAQDPMLGWLGTVPRSLVAAPVVDGTDVVGAVCLVETRRPGRFGPNDVPLVQRLATAAAAVLGRPPAPATLRTSAMSEVHGLLFTDARVAEAVRGCVAMLAPDRPCNLLISGPTGSGKGVFARRVATDQLGLAGVEEVTVGPGGADRLRLELEGPKGAIARAIAGHKALLLQGVHALDGAGQHALLPLLDLPHRRFGGVARSSPVDAVLHVLLETNAPVGDQAWREHFRTDVWFRMSQIHVTLPSLSARGQTVVHEHLARMLQAADAPGPDGVLDPPALHQLLGWPWEGNLRELHGVAQRIAAQWHDRGRRLEVADLAALGLFRGPATDDVLATLELEAVLEALRHTEWVQADAADRLGISKFRLHRLLRKHDLLERVRAERKKYQSGD